MRGKEERKAEGLRTRKERGEEEARERVAVTGARMKREREEETEETRRAGLQDLHLPCPECPRGAPEGQARASQWEFLLQDSGPEVVLACCSTLGSWELFISPSLCTSL